jgi:SAM-dependent methyltransferase
VRALKRRHLYQNSELHSKVTGLPRHYIPALKELRLKIGREFTLIQIQECAQKLARQVKNDFPLVYAGTLLMSHCRTLEAIQLFKQAIQDPFARALMTYLTKSKHQSMPGKPFESIRPFEIWCHTKFFRKETAIIVATVRDFFRKQKPRFNTTPTIVDLGTGNGRLIAQIIKQLAAEGMQGVNLVLIDPSPAMLRAARKRYSATMGIPARITTICNSVETLSKANIHFLREANPQFVIAAASLHHLPRTLKVDVLRMLRGFCHSLLLFELEADHDLAGNGSPELIYSVIKFYGSLIADVNVSNLSQGEKTLCIERFFLAEAIPLLINSYEKRGNFHMSQKQWAGVARRAGFQITASKQHKVISKGPTLLSMLLDSGENRKTSIKR